MCANNVDNTLEFFKESSDSPLHVPFRGQDKILLHHLCADAAVPRKSYSMTTINAAFEQGHNKEHFLGKVVSMFHGLQQALQNDLDRSPLGKYEHAATDYPELYAKILRGISETALEKMAAHIQDFGTSIYPANLGKSVAAQIREDRSKILGDNLPTKETRATIIR